jgi:hypothetical protein
MTHWADRFPLLFANDKPLTAKFEGWVEELRKQRDAEKKEKRSKDRATVASKIDFAPFFAAAAKLVRAVDVGRRVVSCVSLRAAAHNERPRACAHTEIVP